MEDNKHNIFINDRKDIKVSGVLDVISFDEEMVVVETTLGIMILKGKSFHIKRLDLNNKELEIDGEITNLMYEEKDTYSKISGGFLSKIFK